MFWGTAIRGVVRERGTQLCKQSQTPLPHTPGHTHMCGNYSPDETLNMKSLTPILHSRRDL